MDRESPGPEGDLEEEDDFLDPLVGTMVGRFRVEKKIGQGGMGAVYALLQPAIHKRMALKLLHEQYANRPEIVHRFFGEAKAVNLIGHPNIVDISDFSHLPDGRPFIIMEFLEGENLDDYLEEHGALSVEKALGFLKQICSALGAAHAKGIVHRDIKPENFFVTKDHEGRDFVKVLDFGIAKLKNESTGTPGMMHTAAGVVLGTPTYMSPEQAAGNTQGADHRTDLYSLGVVLYQMLTGSPPFEGQTFAELIIKHVQTIPPSINITRSDLPPAWDQLLQKALAKDPEERHQSMAALYEDAVLASTSVAAKAPAAKAKAGNKPPLWLALPAILVLGTAIFFISQRGKGSKPDAKGITVIGVQSADDDANPANAATQAVGPQVSDAGGLDATALVLVPDARRPVPDAAPKVRPQQTPTAVPKIRGTGTLMVSTTPWAHVYVNGKKRGASPLKLELKVGKYRIKLVSGTTGETKMKRVTITKGKVSKVQTAW